MMTKLRGSSVVELGENSSKFSRPTGWILIYGFLGLKMVRDKVKITVPRMTKKIEDTNKQILRRLVATGCGLSENLGFPMRKI